MTTQFKIPFGGKGGGYSEEELDLVREVAARTSPLTQASSLNSLEKQFTGFLQAGGFAFGTSSCTSAIEIIAELLRAFPGEEVIIPTHTYTSSAYPFLKRGFRPVWADSDPRTRVTSPEFLEPLLSHKTKAIVIPHLYGYVADVPGICELAEKYGVPVIEDAAQSIGARLNGKRSGALADFGVFSFHSHKNLTTLGEGGILWVKDESIAKLIPLLRHNGHCPFDFEREDYWKPAMGNVDLPILNDIPLDPANYCLGEVQAALGSKLLERIDEVNQMKRTRALRFIDGHKEEDLLEFHCEQSERHNYHLLAARVTGSKRDAFMRRMSELHGVQCAVQYLPLHRYDYYRKLGFAEANTPNAEDFFENMISFPFHQSLTEADIDYVLDCSLETTRWLT